MRLCRLIQKVALLFTGPAHSMADSQHVIPRYTLCLHAHPQSALATHDVPFPVRADLSFLAFRESAQMNHIQMVAPQIQKIGLGDGLFSIAHRHIGSV